MLGTEASLKVSAYSSAEKDACVDVFDVIDGNLSLLEEFPGDDSAERHLVNAEGEKIQEGYDELCKILDSLRVSNKAQADDLISFLTEIYQKKYDELDLKQMKQESLKGLADFLEKSCEQVLRLAEIMLMFIAEDRLASSALAFKDVQERVEKFSSQLQKLHSILASELFRLSRLFIKFISEKEGAQEGELEEDFQNALQFLTEATLSIAPIFKLMLISSFKSTSEEKEEEKKE